MTAERINSNSAPFPAELESLVNRCKYRPGWRVRLDHLAAALRRREH